MPVGRAHASRLPASRSAEEPPRGEAGSPPGRDGRRRWLAALLLPEPVATEVDGLRRGLGSASLGRIAPHITLVPPRNMSPAGQAAAPAHARAVAARNGPLRLVLGPPGTFAPRTPVVFLEVGGDLEELGELARSLAAGPLAPPPGRDERELVPHVTLSGGTDEHRAAVVCEALGDYRAEVTIDRVTLLEQDDTAPRRPWAPVAEAMLGRPAVVGRGGRELELSLAGRLDPAEQAWFDAEWSAYRLDAYGPGSATDEPFAVVARIADPGIVGVATGTIRPDVLRVARLVVAAPERNSGVGAQLMRFVERLASERGCALLRLETRAGGPAQRFYERLGFAPTATLPHWREGKDFVVMERIVMERDVPGNGR